MARYSRRSAALAIGCAVILGFQGGAEAQGQPPSSAVAAAAHRPHRNLPASAIQLVPPDTSVALLSQVPATIGVQSRYEGDGTLAFSLGESPVGMTIEPETGILTWTPPIESEGSEVDVRVSATDGTSTGEVAFTLRVAAPAPVAATLAGSTLTVTQNGTLKGLAFSFPAQTSVPPAQVAVATLPVGQAPSIPDGVTRLSDLFRVTPVQAAGDMITITMPTTGLPAGRKPQDLRLFVCSDAAEDVAGAADITGRFWIGTWYDLDVLPNGKVSVKLQGLGDLSFIGIAAPVTPPPASTTARASRFRVGALAITTVCAPKLESSGPPDPNCQVCTVGYDTDKSFTVTVKNVSDLHTTPATTLDDLLAWLAAGRKAFDAYGLQTDPSFEAEVGRMPPDISTALGFVTTRNLEDRRVLHITWSPNPRDAIQGTAVHEYFHHAQSRTRTAGKTNLMDGGKERNWLVEGTARWVEDEIFDSLDTYKLKEGSPLVPILEAGLAANPNAASATPASWAYSRFAFWKLIRLHCPGFSLPQILNVDAPLDPRGLKNFKSTLESAGWQCDFVSGLGDAHRATLAGALHHYAVATQRANDVTMLDLDEKPFPFEGPATITPDPSCLPANCPAASKRLVRLQPAGAFSFNVADVPALGPHDQVVLRFKPSFGTAEAIVWIADAADPSPLFGGTTLSLAAPVEHRYGDGRAPRTFMTLINPSVTAVGEVEVQAQIRDTATAPFSGTLEYHPDDLEGLTITSSTAGTVTGPKGLRLERTIPDPSVTRHSIWFSAHVPKTPATIVITGTFEARPNPPSGRFDNPDGSYHTWSFANCRVGGDYGCSPGGAFTFTQPDWADWDYSRNCQVWCDSVTQWFDKDGEMTHSYTVGGGVLAEVRIFVIHEP
jgi:hypothetical protein